MSPIEAMRCQILPLYRLAITCYLDSMKSLTPTYLDALSFPAADLATIQQLGQARGQQELFIKQAPEQLEVLRQAAIVESSESSSRIEGITAPPKRISALLLKSSEPRNRSEQEIAGYRDALNLIHESHPYMPFSVNVALQLHTFLLRYTPEDGGRWKPIDNEIVERGPDGKVIRVRFKTTPAVATEQAMRDLAEAHGRAIGVENREPLVVVPLTILDFLCIHPFRDGNGRVARLLTLLLLYHFDYLVGRFVSLERIIEESKETYYEALEASSKGWHDGAHNPLPWLRYFWGTLLRAYKEFEERAGALVSARGSKTELIYDAVARRMEPFSVTDIEMDCPGISRDMVRHVLRQMRDDGKIEVRGKGRGARWVKKNL